MRRGGRSGTECRERQSEERKRERENERKGETKRDIDRQTEGGVREKEKAGAAYNGRR